MRPVLRLREERGLTVTELLIATSISLILSALMIWTWIALNDSYGFSTRSAVGRDLARNAMARLAREIRDSEARPGFDAITYADPFEIRFTTTFNDARNVTDDMTPVLTRYWIDSTDGVLHRQRDTNGSGSFDTEDRVEDVVHNLLNRTTASPASLFRYTYVDPAGDFVETDSPPSTTFIIGVHINLRLDLNPGKAPEPVNLATAVQLRNQRHF